MIVECPGCKSRYDVSGRPAGTRARCRCGTIFELPEPPRSAGYLQCPQCAAAVGVGETRCTYCSAELLVRACPRCFARMFHGSKHCRHCGAVVDAPAAADAGGEATPRMCPRCRHGGDVRLEGRLVDGHLIDECGECHGVYVDVATLERLLADRRQSSASDAMGFARGGTGQMAAVRPPPSGPAYVPCPDCDQLMNRRNFGRASGVIVDVCRHHGTWFDAEELPRIIEFVRSGGLERAERRDIEREREEARRAKASAVAEAHAARSQGNAALLGSRRSGLGSVALDGLLGALGRLLSD